MEKQIYWFYAVARVATVKITNYITNSLYSCFVLLFYLFISVIVLWGIRYNVTVAPPRSSDHSPLKI